MLDVDQHAPKARSSSLAQWVYHAIGQPGVRLRVRLGGNNLHILCESRQGLEAKTVVDRLIEALENREAGDPFPVDPENPVYQLIIYGRTLGRDRPDWIKQIRLKPPVTQEIKATGSQSDAQLKASHENLARSGSPEAIGRYLSETLNPLGVSVKVLIQTLPEATPKKATVPQSVAAEAPDRSSETFQFDADTHALNRRLWVICNSNYSPDPSVLTEPVVQQLRSLQLNGFRDAAICSQVSGESAPEWMLRVDLTPPEEMLKAWANWGDVQAIARLLNQVLLKSGMEARAVLKDATLHLFCSPLVAQPTMSVDKQKAVSAIAEVLDAITPQGIQAATLYGIESSEKTLSPEQEKPTWIEWLNLPAANNPALGESALSLAQKGNWEALTFLLERLLNPDLDRRLATGGIHLKVRRKQDLLHIMSEAPICPPQTQVAPPIGRFLRQLTLPDIAGVRIYGRRAGSTSPLWNYGVDFVGRQRLVPEATPEFAASDAYINDLIAPAGESVLHRDLRPEELQDGMQRTLRATARTLGRWLCATHLFVKSEDNEATTLVAQRESTKNFASAQGFKVALVWGMLGLLLSVQVDWLIGQMLRNVQLQAKSPIAPATTQESPTAVPLPQISLQKAEDRGTNGFNSSGFTRDGRMNVIVNDGENVIAPGRRSAKTALLSAARTPNPSFNNPLLDEKLALYQQRLLKSGPPDVLIIGSSRALRGVDPLALQEALAAKGYPNIEVFNFAINGATVQVVDFIIRRVLTPEQLPKLIIWADGARAFNSGRDDTTYNAIASSEGYQHLEAGTFPNLTGDEPGNRRAGKGRSNNQNGATDQPLASLDVSYQSINEWIDRSLGKISSTYAERDKLKSLLREQYVSLLKQANISPTPTEKNPENLSSEEGIDVEGFLPLSVRYNPSTYYKKHPKVLGDYDNDYKSFRLNGEQDMALDELMQFARGNNIEMVFVNLPLTKDYLDPARTEYEEKFQQYMRSSARVRGLIFRDLSQLLLTKPDLFSDPSHLNRYGADKVSNQLAQDPLIPWPVKKTGK